METIDLSWAI